MEGRLTPPWQPWEAIPVGVFALAVGLLASVLLALVTGGVGGSGLLLAGIAFEVSLAAVSVLWISIRYPGWVPALGLRSPRAVGDVVVGALVGVVTVPVIAVVVYPVVTLVWDAVTGHPPGPINQLPIDFTPGAIVLGAFSVVVVTPFAEEIFFRGFLHGSLRGRFGFLASAALSAATFALLHPPPQLMVLIFFVGLVLAWLYERRGSLIAPIAAHASFNLVGFALIVMQRT